MRIGLISCLLFCAGCTLGLDYNQCNEDADCARYEGQPFCTQEHICVPNRPVTSLCREVHPAQPVPKAVHIGAFFNLSTEGQGALDRLRLAALKLGVDEINDQYRFNMKNVRPIALHICDTSGARSQGDLERMLTFLVNDQRVVGVVGPTTSEEVELLASHAASLQVPLVSPSATASVLDRPTQGWVFRVAPAESLQAQRLAQLPMDFPNNNREGAVKLTIVSVLSDYGENLRRAFQDSWNGRNPANNFPVATPTFQESLEATENVQRVARGLLAQDPPPTHILLIVSRQAQPHALTFLGVLRELKTYTTLGATPTKIWLTDGAFFTKLLQLTTDPTYEKVIQNLEGISPLSLERETAVNRLSSTASEFRTNLSTNMSYKVPVDPETGAYDIYIGYTYDAFYTLGMAVQSILGDAITSAQVATALRRVKSKMPNQVYAIGPGSFASFLNGANALRSGNDVAIRGVTGTIRFTDEGDRETALFERWKLVPPQPAMEGMPEKPAYFSLRPL